MNKIAYSVKDPHPPMAFSVPKRNTYMLSLLNYWCGDKENHEKVHLKTHTPQGAWVKIANSQETKILLTKVFNELHSDLSRSGCRSSNLKHGTQLYKLFKPSKNSL